MRHQSPEQDKTVPQTGPGWGQARLQGCEGIHHGRGPALKQVPLQGTLTCSGWAQRSNRDSEIWSIVSWWIDSLLVDKGSLDSGLGLRSFSYRVCADR